MATSSSTTNTNTAAAARVYPQSSVLHARVVTNGLVLLLSRDDARAMVRGLRLKAHRTDAGNAFWIMHGHGLIVWLCRPSGSNGPAEYTVVVMVGQNQKG